MPQELADPAPEITPDSIPAQPADDGDFDPVSEMTRAFQEAGYDADNVDVDDLKALDSPQSTEQDPVVPDPEVPAQPVGDNEPASDQGILDYIRSEYGDEEADRLAQKYNSNDAEVLKGLINAQHLVGRRDDAAKFGEQFKQWAPQFGEFLAQQQQQVPPAAAYPPQNPYLPPQGYQAQPQYPQPPQYQQQQAPTGYGLPGQQIPPPGVQEPRSQRPRFDPRWREDLRVNPETNEIEGPDDLVRAYRDYQRYEKERSQKLLEEGLTREEVVPLIRQEAQRIASEQLNQQWTRYKDESAAKDFLDTNKDWMFEGGQYRVAGGQLQGRLSEAGQRFTQHYLAAAQEAAHYNVAPEYRASWAQRTAEARLQAETAQWIMSHQAQQNQATPNATAVQHKPPAPNHQAMLHQPSVTQQTPGDQLIRQGETMDQALMRQISEANGGDVPRTFEDLLKAEMVGQAI